MKVHFLNCGNMLPRFAGLFVPDLAKVQTNCMLIEINGQAVLVDTGLGTKDMNDTGRLGPANIILNVRPDPDMTAVIQVRRLGHAEGDIRHIICTHLDLDHAGGLPDFPGAKVHVLKQEYDAMNGPSTLIEKERYRKCHFLHGPQWVLHDNEEVLEKGWYGMDCIRNIPGIPGEIVLVPLPGHTRGHCGVAVDTGNGWILHCGDTYYVRTELDGPDGVPFGVKGFRAFVHIHRHKAMVQLERLKKIITERKDEIRIISSHERIKPGSIFTNN